MVEDVINGKITKIVSQYQVIVNAGYSDGVKKDMKFIIYDKGEEIIDPDTKKSLGKVEIVKARIEPIHIQENFTTMETYEQETTSIRKMLLSSQHAYRQKPLPLSYEPSGKSSIRAVQIGDLVRQDLS